MFSVTVVSRRFILQVDKQRNRGKQVGVVEEVTRLTVANNREKRRRLEAELKSEKTKAELTEATEAEKREKEGRLWAEAQLAVLCSPGTACTVGYNTAACAAVQFSMVPARRRQETLRARPWFRRAVPSRFWNIQF